MNYKMKKGGKWIQKAIKKPGSFTAQANRAGMSVPAFRDKVLSNKDDFSPTTVKRANLAKTLARMKKKGQMGMDMQSSPQPQKAKDKKIIPNYKPTKLGIMSIKMKKGGVASLKSFLGGKRKKC